MIEGTASEQTRFKSISPDHISFSRSTVSNVHQMHDRYATAQHTGAACWLCSQSHYIHIWQRGYYIREHRGGKMRISNDQILPDRLCIFHTGPGITFAFHTRKRIPRSSCLFNWIWPLEGVALEEMRCGPFPPVLEGKYASHLNACLAAAVYLVVLSSLSQQPCDLANFLAVMMHDILKVMLI